MTAENKIILHWLDQSRSNRILWLLEKLDVNYEVKIYKRNKAFRAPRALYDVHPLGKSPVIEVVKPTGEKEVIAETGCIIEYLIDTYDHQHKLVPATEEGKRQVSYFLHYTEGTLQPFLTGAFVNAMAKTQAPFGVSFLVGAITGRINDMYYKAESITNLKFLEDIAKKNSGNWFVEDKITAADIILCYPVAELVFLSDSRSSLFNPEPKQQFPNLYKWVTKVLDDEDYKKCADIIEAQSKL